MKTLMTAVVAMMPIMTMAEIATGWTQSAASGGKATYYFNDPDNWVNGEVNGVFSEDFTAVGETTICLTNDWSGALKIYSSLAGKVTLQTAYVKGVCESARTYTITDDIDLLPSSMTADFTFGNSYNAGNKLGLDLGGVTRRINISGARWIFSNRMTNGDVVFNGSGTFTLRSAAGFDGNVTLCPGLILALGYTSSDKSAVNVTRAKNITLNRSQLTLATTQVSSSNTFAGRLKVENSTGCSVVYSKASDTLEESTTFGSLEMDRGAMLLFRGARMGKTAGAGSSNVYFTEAPAMIGGIVPGVIAAPTDSDTSGMNASYDQTLAAYDSAMGVVPLALDTDYVTELTDSTPATANVRLPNATEVTIEKDTTINSLYLVTDSSSDTFTKVASTNGAVLKVTSGMVLVGYPVKAGNYKYPNLAAAIDFGNVPGYIIYHTGKRSQMDGSIHGTAGVTFATPIGITAAVATSGLYCGSGMGESTYTGDTFVNTALSIGTANCFPHGKRTGDVYVNGYLLGDNFTINGLYGSGSITRASSGGKSMTLGDNDADGDFSGNITITDSGAKLHKIGKGRQRFSGTLTLNSEIDVEAGSVIIDGSVAQGAVKISSGAAFGGNGAIATSVDFAEGSTFAVEVSDGTMSCLKVTGAVTGSATVSLADGATCSLEQPILMSETSMAGAVFAKGTNVGRLRLSDDGLTLYATPKLKGLFIIIR